jgi:tetratricopeptide (TPR) repeat protein
MTRRRWILSAVFASLLVPAVAQAQAAAGSQTQAQEKVIKGDAALKAGRYKEAVALFVEALAFDRTLLPAYEKLAAAYYVLKEHREAVTRLRQCVQVQANHIPCILHLGLHLWNLKQIQESVQHLEAAVKADAKLALGQYRLSYHYLRTGQYQRATTAAWAFLNHRDKDLAVADPRVRMTLGTAYLRLGKYAEAEQQFSLISKARPQDVAVKLLLAEAMLGRGYYSGALTIYLANQGLAAKRPEIWLNMARCYQQLRQDRQAIDTVRKYQAARPRDVDGIILEGDIYFAAKQWGPALAAFKRATEVAPGSIDAKVRYGEALLEQKQYDTATAVLLGAARVQPQAPAVLLALGRVYTERKMPREALQYLDKLVRLQPKQASGWVQRGDAYIVAKKYTEAVADFRQALALDRNGWRAKRGFVSALNRRAQDALQNGQADAAITDLKEALKIDPERLFTKINLGIAALVGKRPAEALGYLQDAYRKLPTNFSVNRLLGRVYFEQGNLAQARTHYEKARTSARRMTSQFQAELEIEYGALLAALDQIEAAVTVLKSAVQSAVGNAGLVELAQGNLAIALMDRGYRRLDAGKGPEALTDLEEAKQHIARLKDNQPNLLEFLLAMAYLENGRWAQAAEGFRKLSGGKVLAQVLNPPFDRLGAAYFQAYILYRQGGFEAAANEMRKLLRAAPEVVKVRIRDIIRSSYELLGTAAVRRGDAAGARKAFGNAKNLVLSRQGQLNLGVALYKSGKAGEAIALWQAGGMPAVALCNVGTHYDNLGEPQKAYEYYTRCKAAGGSSGDINGRIDTIKRLFGY